ncbi:MAG TPA: hypothetical protein VIE43_16365 [Thermoanaerobaculia bacterium]|nr:hypothetical protein [Thermoanaerobaculia bacterium]
MAPAPDPEVPKGRWKRFVDRINDTHASLGVIVGVFVTGFALCASACGVLYLVIEKIKDSDAAEHKRLDDKEAQDRKELEGQIKALQEQVTGLRAYLSANEGIYYDQFVWICDKTDGKFISPNTCQYDKQAFSRRFTYITSVEVAPPPKVVVSSPAPQAVKP